MRPVSVLEVPQDILDSARLSVDELKVEMAVQRTGLKQEASGQSGCDQDIRYLTRLSTLTHIMAHRAKIVKWPLSSIL